MGISRDVHVINHTALQIYAQQMAAFSASKLLENVELSNYISRLTWQMSSIIIYENDMPYQKTNLFLSNFSP